MANPISARIGIPMNGMAVRNDLIVGNLKSQVSAKIPVYSSGNLPPANSSNARQGYLAFQQDSTSGLENASGTLMFFDGSTWTPSSGATDVHGPGSSTDNALTRFDGTTGKYIQNSLAILDDSGNLTLPGTVTAANIPGNFVSGPVSATNDAVATYNGTTGKVIQDSLVSIDSSGNITTPGTINGVVFPGDFVSGPTSATDTALARFDTTTGKLIKNSLVLVDDSGNLSTTGTVTGSNIVSGPVSSTNNAVATYNGTTGKLIQNSLVTIDGSGNLLTTGTVIGSNTIAGPSSSTNNAIATYSGVTGKIIQNSLIMIDGSGNLSTPGTITASNVPGNFVSGPTSSTTNAIAIYNGTTGKIIQNSLATIDGSGNIATSGTITASNLSGTNTGNVTLAAVDSTGTPNANAATLTGQVLNLNSASQTQPGAVNIATQSFSGAKTFVTSLGINLGTNATTGVFMIGGNRALFGLGTTNFFLGTNAGNFTMTGTGNVTVGIQALVAATSGSRNMMIGTNAGSKLTTGSDNVLVGDNAGVNAVITGTSNIGIGSNALAWISSGSANIGIGTNALSLMGSGGNNVAMGYASLNIASSGTGNTAIGSQCLQSITTGTNNTSIGFSSGNGLGANAQNTILIGNSGTGAADNSIHIGGSHTTAYIAGVTTITPTGTLNQVVINSTGQLGSGVLGVNNLALPVAATAPNEGANITISGNTNTLRLEFTDATHNGILSTTTQTIAGNKTFNNNIDFVNATSTATVGLITKNGTQFIHNLGTQNTFLGYNAGSLAGTYSQNVGIGYNVLQAATTGGSHAIVGNTAGQALVSGQANSILGHQAMLTATTCSNSVAVGAHALQTISTGDQNTVVGFNCFGLADGITESVGLGNNVAETLTTGNGNTIIGSYAGQNIASGSGNTFLGQGAGNTITSGSNNIYIGNTGVATESSTIRFGTGANQTRFFTAGVRGVTTGNADAINVVIDSAGQLGTVSSSARYKNTIQDMGETPILNLRPVTFFYNTQTDRKRQYGLIAEEVDKVLKDIVVYDDEGRPETVQYQHLIPMLLNEVIKQSVEIKSLKEELKKQNKMIEEFLSR